MLLALVQLGSLQFRRESEWHRFRAIAIQHTTGSATTKRYEQLDRLAEQTVKGNVLLELAGYARSIPAAENFSCLLYYRLNYTLYPGRMYVAPADHVINNGQDIVQTEFNPSPQWLQEHDVRSALIFGVTGDGRVTLQLKPLPPSGSQSGRQADKSGGK